MLSASADSLPNASSAILVDYENVNERFHQGATALLNYCRSRGRVLIKKAYADWSAIPDKHQRCLVSIGYELIGLTAYHRTGKNAADIRLVVDALAIAHTNESIDTFVLLTGDSDYIPLIVQLRAIGKRVILVNTRGYVSESLMSYCDEVIPLSRWKEDEKQAPTETFDRFTPLRNCLDTMFDGSTVLASTLKPAMIRLDPAFDESEYGFKRFGDYLRAARDAGVISISHNGHTVIVVEPVHPKPSSPPE
ncbi:NYN domain protein [Planctomycetes bacterium MalM25]|nr:NYN domain protein [Planctomycetes bacterium MalM25]